MYCVCGHEEDEHSLTGECQVEKCACAAFESEEDEDEEGEDEEDGA